MDAAHSYDSSVTSTYRRWRVSEDVAMIEQISLGGAFPNPQCGAR